VPAELLGLDLRTTAWLPRAVRLSRGTTKHWIKVPTRDANLMLREVSRVVADLPVDSSPDVVWRSGANELLVDTGGTTLAFSTGLVQVRVPVSCDQLGEPATVLMSFATGTEKEPRGLFMSTFAKPEGPKVVVDVWAQALAAYAWECLLTLALHLSAAAGKDAEGRPLVPAAIASARGYLQVLPMVRS
jgi:hypothetical protein